MEELNSEEVVSLFFTNRSTDNKSNNEVGDIFLNIIDELNDRLNDFNLPPAVKCVYKPTEYARYTFELYVRKYCNTKKKIMYFGMNPGPWGMSQTGVPFGEINYVKDWLGIQGPINKPPRELVTRPVKGFECPRSEISGKRFWGLFKEICGVPENFFRTSFVYNYLPEQWMKENGSNLTPCEFKETEIHQLYSICDPIFCKVIDLYGVELIVAVGRFCEKRAAKAIKKYLPSHNIKIVYLPHPSPRTSHNNNWSEKAIDCLSKHQLLQHYKYSEFLGTT